MPKPTHLRAAAAAVIVAALTAGGLPTMAEADGAARMPNAVQRWNQTAGAVALASCISPGADPLHESRMYAVSSLAAHDALNAIDRRFKSYALRGVRVRRASQIAAVAAASRTALTSAVRELPEDLFGQCRPAAFRVIEQAYAAELDRVPRGRAKDRGVRLGTAAAQAVIKTRAGDGSDTPMIVGDYPQGTKPGEWRFTPDRPFAFAPGWGDVRPFALKGTAGFRVEPAVPARQRRVRPRPRRGQGIRQRRPERPERPHTGPDRGGTVLDREQPLAVEPDRPRCRGARRVGRLELGAAVRAAQHVAGGRLHRFVFGEIRESVLAARDRDPRGSNRR